MVKCRCYHVRVVSVAAFGLVAWLAQNTRVAAIGRSGTTSPKTADCGGLEDRISQVICQDVDARQLASKVDDLIESMAGRHSNDALAARANQSEWRSSFWPACTRMDPNVHSGMDLTQCVRLVLHHRIEVLQTDRVDRGVEHPPAATLAANDPQGALPTSRRRRYSFQVTSRTLEYFWNLLGDFYVSNTEMLLTRIGGVFRLAYAGETPDDFGERDMSGARVYRVLNAREVRAANARGSRIDERFYQGLCSTDEHVLRWLIIRADVDGLGKTFVKLSTAYIHDYADLMTRAYGSCGTFYLEPAP
jgi:hypothetical protein